MRCRLLTLAEAAIYLGRSHDSVRELLYERELRCVQRGDRGKIWIPVDELERWIERNLDYL